MGQQYERITLQAREGALFVLHETTSYNSPAKLLHFYPTGLRAYDLIVNFGEEYIGAELVEAWQRSGSYKFKEWKGYGNGPEFHLEQYGKTLPSFFEEVPIPKPKSKLEHEWRCGQWYKLLKSGWVNVGPCIAPWK